MKSRCLCFSCILGIPLAKGWTIRYRATQPYQPSLLQLTMVFLLRFIDPTDTLCKHYCQQIRLSCCSNSWGLPTERRRWEGDICNQRHCELSTELLPLSSTATSLCLPLIREYSLQVPECYPSNRPSHSMLSKCLNTMPPPNIPATVTKLLTDSVDIPEIP